MGVERERVGAGCMCGRLCARARERETGKGVREGGGTEGRRESARVRAWVRFYACGRDVLRVSGVMNGPDSARG